MVMALFSTLSIVNGARSPIVYLVISGLFMALLAVWLLTCRVQLVRHRIHKHFALVWVAWGVLLLICCLQSRGVLGFYSADPYQTWIELYLYGGYGSAMLLFVALLRNTQRIRWCVAIILVTAIWQTLFGMINYYSGSPVLGWAPTHYAFIRVTGTHVNRNFFANMVAMAACFPLVWLLTKSHLSIRRSERAIHGNLSGSGLLYSLLASLILVILLAGLLLSGSRAAILSIIVAPLVLLMAVLLDRHLQIALKSFAASVCIAILLFGAGLTTSRFSNLMTDSSERLKQWMFTIDMIGRSLWSGQGAGAYETMFRSRASGQLLPLTYDHAHSDYLELLSEFGLLGFIIIGLAIVFIIVKAMRRAYRSKSLLRKRLVLASVMGSVVMLSHALVDFPLQVPANVWIFIALLSIMMSASIIDFRQHLKDIR